MTKRGAYQPSYHTHLAAIFILTRRLMAVSGKELMMNTREVRVVFTEL